MSLEIRPLHPLFAAEITGIDRRQGLRPDASQTALRGHQAPLQCTTVADVSNTLEQAA